MDNVSKNQLEVTDTPQTLAQALKTTPQTINGWHRRGIIPSVFTSGRVVRFNRNQVIAALADQSKFGKS
jgi:predicted site-specific integrase-resolvase